MSVENSENQGSALQIGLQNFLNKSEKLLKKGTAPKFLRIFDRDSEKNNNYRNDSSNEKNQYPHKYNDISSDKNQENQDSPSLQSTRRAVQHFKNQKTLGELQSSFEKKLEKIKSLKFSTISKSLNFKNNQNRSTSVRNQRKEPENLPHKNTFDLEKTRKNKTEQSMYEPISHVAAFNHESTAEKGPTFSFKGSPRSNTKIKGFHEHEENKEFPVCKNHSNKRAKYTIYLPEAPVLCSKCAVVYANDGYKLKPLGTDYSLERIIEDSHNESSERRSNLSLDYKRIQSLILSNSKYAKYFYSKQRRNMEEAFYSITSLLERQKEEADNAISLYESKTLEKLSFMKKDLEKEYKGFLTSKDSSNPRLKTSLTMAGEDLTLYKFKPDTTRIQKLIKQISPLYFVYPSKKPKGLNRTMESALDNSVSGQKFHSMIVKNLDSTNLEKSSFRKPFISTNYCGKEFQSHFSKVDSSKNLRNLTKVDDSQLEKGYFVFEDKESAEFKPSEKRSSLSSPNFVSS